MVRVERVYDPRFLTQQKNVAPIRSRSQQWGRAKIEIVATFVGTVIFLVGNATAIPQIFRRKLPMPELLARPHIDRDHGVGCVTRRRGIIVASCNINYMPFEVGGRRRPDSRTRRTEILDALCALAS